MLDIVLMNQPTRPFSATTTRRDFLRLGSLAGLTLPALVHSQGAAGTIPLAPRARSVILIFLGGGLSHLDSFDVKPEASEDIRGPYSPIRTSVPGLTISEKLPLMGRVMDRLTLVRSGTHDNNHHETATNWVLSGRLGTPFGDYPAVGAVVAHETGLSAGMPPYVAVPRNPSYTWELGKSAFLGPRYEAFKAGDPSQINYPGPVAVMDQICQRIATSEDCHSQSQEPVISSEARRAFVLDQEPAWLRDRYGRTTAGQSLLLARRLVERGVRFVIVNYEGWDYHTRIFENLNQKLPEFDQSVSALIEDLDARGSLSDTLLVVLSEFSRTPKVNKVAGRDHWAHANSLLFAGAGVQRGGVVGKTDRHGAFPTQRPVSPADVAFTILTALGIDPRKQLHLPDGRPMPILDQGEFIHELFT